MNGHERRTVARRSAWRDAAEALRLATLRAPHPEVAADPSASALYWETRAKVQAWLDRRAKGKLGPPPGGVGVAK